LAVLLGSCNIHPSLPVMGEPAEPMVYGVFIGDGNVSLQSMNTVITDLRYSDNDAYNTLRCFKQWSWVDESYLLVTPDAGNLGGKIPSEAIWGDASWENITFVLSEIATTITIDDFFILYYSGNAFNGVLNLQEKPGSTYIDINYSTFFGYLDGLDSRASALLMDASCSGSIQRAQSTSARDYVTLASDNGNQDSMKGSSWNGSLFTSRLLYHYGMTNGLCSIIDGFTSVVGDVMNSTIGQQVPILINGYPDLKMNLRTRAIRPMLAIAFVKDDVGRTINRDLTGYPGEEKKIIVSMIVSNHGTSKTSNIIVLLVDEDDQGLGSTKISSLPFDSESMANITITLVTGESTGHMTARASCYYKDTLYSASSDPGTGAIASVEVNPNLPLFSVRNMIFYLNVIVLMTLGIMAVAIKVSTARRK